MSTLKEIRERHNYDETHVLTRGFKVAHNDRGELLKMAEELEAQLEAVRGAIDPCLSVDELIAKIQAAIGDKS